MKQLIHLIKLPGLVIPGNIFLAPMAGFTDRAMREVCVRFGADMTYSEMVSCEGVIRKNQKTIDLVYHGKTEKYFAVQIFTSSARAAFKSVRTLAEYSPSMIDLNCGCPVPKVTKTGAGSALMKSPEIIGEIVKAVKNALAECGHPDIPFSVKLRKGWDTDSITYLQAAESAQKAGADMISLHPRTRKEGYSGKADWSCIKKLKEISSVPVIGSGDLFTSENIFSMLEQTGCDGVMIARGANGNPFIFSEVKGKPRPESEKKRTVQQIKAAEKQLKLAVRYLGETRACKEMKKHICAYTKGLRGGAALRNAIVHCESSAEYIRYLKEYLNSL